MHTENKSESDPNTKIRTLLDFLNTCVFEKKVSQLEIAAATGIDQSQVSRILNGEFRRSSKNVQKLCLYANSLLGISEKPSPATNQVLMLAIGDVWDGTDKHAMALATVIRSLSSLHS